MRRGTKGFLAMVFKELDRKAQRDLLKNMDFTYAFLHEPGGSRKLVGYGETVSTYCMSAFNGFIDSEKSFEEAMGSGKHHPITGPFSIGELSKDEDILVCIDKIIPFDDRVWCITKSAGALAYKFRGYDRTAAGRHFKLFSPPYKDTQAMLGVIGTVPKHKDIGSGRGGMHGGNMDLPCIREGAKIILPSYHGYSDVWMGDMHAAQGCGELSGVALECSGNVVFRMYPIKLCKKTSDPIIIQSGKNGDCYEIYFTGCRSSFQRAVRAAADNAVRHIQALHGIDFVEAYQKIGLSADLVVGQAVGKTISVGIKICADHLDSFVENIRGEEFKWQVF